MISDELKNHFPAKIYKHLFHYLSQKKVNFSKLL